MRLKTLLLFAVFHQCLFIFSQETNPNSSNTFLFEDKNGNFWAGLDRGISYIQYLDNMSYYTDPNGNIGAVYDAFYWKNKLYIGTNQGLFYMPEDKLKSVMMVEQHIKL